MANISNIKLPKIDPERFAKDSSEIVNYLIALEDVLKYMFGHIDDENLTDEAMQTFKTEDGTLTKNNAIEFLNDYYVKIESEVLTRSNGMDFLDEKGVLTASNAIPFLDDFYQRI